MKILTILIITALVVGFVKAETEREHGRRRRDAKDMLDTWQEEFIPENPLDLILPEQEHLVIPTRQSIYDILIREQQHLQGLNPLDKDREQQMHDMMMHGRRRRDAKDMFDTWHEEFIPEKQPALIIPEQEHLVIPTRQSIHDILIREQQHIQGLNLLDKDREQQMHDMITHGRRPRDVRAIHRPRSELRQGHLKLLPQHRVMTAIEGKIHYNHDQKEHRHPMHEAMTDMPGRHSGPWNDMRGHGQSQNIVIQMNSIQRPGVHLCPTCVDFTGQAINELLNIILNAGVIGSCGELCKLLEEKTGSKALELVCNLVCDYAGVKEFIKFIEKADLDPIYFCELIKICPIFDNGDATITMLVVDPESGPQGQKLISLSYVSKNGTGTGELVFAVKTVDGIPVESASLLEQSPPGKYSGNIKLNATPDPSCDPTQQLCEMWLPGIYTVEIAICNGECGSKHPHSKIYDQKKANFTITG